MSSRRSFLRMAAAPWLARAASPPRAQALPNFVLVMTDDQGYGDLGCYGSAYIRTPAVDRMAREGVRFTDFYAAPLCGPSRAALMTGCYPPRNSLNFNHIPRAKTGIHPNELTLGELLKSRGYATMAVGKWHLGDAPEFLPTRHGFDEWFGLPNSNDMWPLHPKVRRVGPESPLSKAVRERAEMTGFDGQGQHYPPDWFPDLPLMRGERVLELNPDQSKLTGQYTDEALRFIRANRQRPFFLYVAHSMPHVPLFPGAKFDGRSLRGRYGDVIEEIDDSMGRILALLAELKLDSRTLVVYTSDNGPWLPYGMDAGSAGPLRAGKASVWEGGIRVPAVMRWPGRIPAGLVTSEVGSTMDFFHTFAHLSDTSVPPDRTIDSLNIWPLMSQPGARSPRDVLYFFNAAGRYDPAEGRPENTGRLGALRSGPWKLHVEDDDRGLRGQALYNLREDIGETRDVLSRHPRVADELLAKARQFLAELRRNIRPLGVASAP